MDLMKFLTNKIIWFNQSEKQNESEDKSQRFMTALTLLLALTFCAEKGVFTDE